MLWSQSNRISTFVPGSPKQCKISKHTRQCFQLMLRYLLMDVGLLESHMAEHVGNCFVQTFLSRHLCVYLMNRSDVIYFSIMVSFSL